MGADGRLAYQVSGSRGAGCGVWFLGESVLVKDPEVTPRRGTNVSWSGTVLRAVWRPGPFTQHRDPSFPAFRDVSPSAN